MKQTNENNFAAILAWVLFIAAILILALFQNEKNDIRINNPLYTTGFVIGIASVARGAEYVNYTFVVDQKTYNGSVSISFVGVRRTLLS